MKLNRVFVAIPVLLILFFCFYYIGNYIFSRFNDQDQDADVDPPRRRFREKSETSFTINQRSSRRRNESFAIQVNSSIKERIPPKADNLRSSGARTFFGFGYVAPRYIRYLRLYNVGSCCCCCSSGSNYNYYYYNDYSDNYYTDYRRRRLNRLRSIYKKNKRGKGYVRVVKKKN